MLNAVQWYKKVLNTLFHVLSSIRIGVMITKRPGNSKIRLLSQLLQENFYRIFFGHLVCYNQENKNGQSLSNNIGASNMIKACNLVLLETYLIKMTNTHIAHNSQHRCTGCTFVKLVYFFAEITQNVGVFCPILTIWRDLRHSLVYFLQAWIVQRWTKIDKYEVCSWIL